MVRYMRAVGDEPGRPCGGDKARILAALRACRDAGQDWPLYEELARKLDVSMITVRLHVGGLEREHRVEVFAPTIEIPCKRVRLLEESLSGWHRAPHN